MNAREEDVDVNEAPVSPKRSPLKMGCALFHALGNVALRRDRRELAVELSWRSELRGMMAHNFARLAAPENARGRRVDVEELLLVLQHHALARRFEKSAMLLHQFTQRFFPA